MPDAPAGQLVLDAKALAQLAAVDDGQLPNLLDRLCRLFLDEEGPRCMGEMRQALAAADVRAFAACAHRLAGSALVFGAARLVAACRAGEAASEADAAAGAFPAIEAAFAEVAAELRRHAAGDPAAPVQN